MHLQQILAKGNELSFAKVVANQIRVLVFI
jgi:hypothetical protein